MNESEMNKLPEETGKPETPVGPLPPGATLKRHREERGWTVEQVASQLNLAPRQVLALERDDYPALPGMAVARGFMRSYAKLLGLDPVPLLASLGGEAGMSQESLPSRKTLSTPFSETRMPSMNDKAWPASKWVMIGLLTLLAGVGIWAAQQNSQVADLSKSASDQVRDGFAHLSGPDASKQAEGAGTVATPQAKGDAPVSSGQVAPEAGKPADAGKSAAPAADAQKAPEPTAAAPAPGSTDESAKVPPAGTTAAPATAPSAAAPAGAVNPAVNPAPAAPGSNPLVVTVREEAWVTIKRANDNSVVFSRLMKAGSTETIEIPAPVNIVIGNAAGATATLRGAAVDIKPGSGNVARFSLK
jgi:cytoskeleton protein RodZ